MKKILLITILLLILVGNVEAATYYARTDGSNSTNCTGLADAAYDGSGTGEACAFNHPNWCFEIQGQPAGVCSGGDTLIVGAGTYYFGCMGSASDCRDSTINISSSATCDNDYPQDCYPEALPDGSVGDLTEIIGCSVSGCGVTNCHESPGTCPKFIGRGRVRNVVNLGNTDYARIKHIDITDGAALGSGHPTLAGVVSSSDAEDEVSGLYGVYAIGSTNIELEGNWIHGMYSRGIFTGNNNGTNNYTNNIVNFNSMGGFEYDCDGSGTCGALGIENFTGTVVSGRYQCQVNFNGCIEDAGTPDTAVSQGCYEQLAGGYGDGIGSGNTGADFNFTGCEVSWNTSDGLDLLYQNKGASSGGQLVIRESRFEGNNGNQVKSSNEVDTQSSYLIGNCGYFYNRATTYGTNDRALFNTCRASGNTIELTFYDNNNSPKIIGNTITGNGDVMINTSGTCTASTDVIDKNNIYLGGRQFNDDSTGATPPCVASCGDDTISIYYDTDGPEGSNTCDTERVETNNICIGLKEGASACNGTNSNDTAVATDVFNGTTLQGPNSSPGYYRTTDYIDILALKSGGTAIDFADESVSGATGDDFWGNTRPASWDDGALEYGSTPSGGGGGSGTGITMGTVKFGLGGVLIRKQ